VTPSTSCSRGWRRQFESQRRFVANRLARAANADHRRADAGRGSRSRTPMQPSHRYGGTCTRVLAASEQQERLIESLLTLGSQSARSRVSGRARPRGHRGRGSTKRAPERDPGRVRAGPGADEGRTPRWSSAWSANLVDKRASLQPRARRLGDGLDGCPRRAADAPGVQQRARCAAPRPAPASCSSRFRRLDGERTDARGAGPGPVDRSRDRCGARTPRCVRRRGSTAALDVEVSFPPVAARHEVAPVRAVGDRRGRVTCCPDVARNRTKTSRSCS